MNLLFGILFGLYFFSTAAVWFCGALAIWLLTLPFDRDGRVLHQYSCAWGWFCIRSNPAWRVRIEGVERVDRHRAYVIVSNHQSFFDILFLSGTFLPFKWVSKSSIFWIPFVGWNMRLNRYVGLVRGDRRSIERMADRCVAWLQRGVSVLLFPEGTRAEDGKLQAFKIGSFRIAKRANVPLLPIILDGTGKVLPKYSLLPRPVGDVRIRVLDPIDSAPFETPEALADAVRAQMDTALDALRRG